MTRNDVLMELGQRYLNELNLSQMKYAFVGGSVGRGNADEFSDVDITICVKKSAVSKRILLDRLAIAQKSDKKDRGLLR